MVDKIKELTDAEFVQVMKDQWPCGLTAVIMMTPGERTRLCDLAARAVKLEPCIKEAYSALCNCTFPGGDRRGATHACKYIEKELGGKPS